jgi:hypothetical protein
MNLDNAQIKKLNSLLEQATQSIVCGPTCQKERTFENLKQKYLDAQTNVITAPEQLSTATKNFYVFGKGEQGYNDYLEKQLTVKANKLGDLITQNFSQQLNSNADDLEKYGNLLKDTNVAKELNDVIIKKIANIQNELLGTRTNKVTNNRKTYYEDQQIQNLKSWYKFFYILYYIFSVALIISLFTSPSTLSISKKIIILILVLLYPLFMLPLAKFLMRIFDNVSFLLPKDVYKNI